MISSHVLYEIEALTSDIVVIYRGQVLAEGNVYEIRKLIDQHPHRIRVECDQPRVDRGGAGGEDHIARLIFERGAVLDRDPRSRSLLRPARGGGARGDVAVSALTSPDNNLGAVFEYLTGDGGGVTNDRAEHAAPAATLVRRHADAAVALASRSCG